MIKIIDGKYKYDDAVIFENLNLEIEKGKITAIIGCNGIGKTTLANILSGLFLLKSGKLLIDDMLINKRTKSYYIRNKISIVSQNPDNFIIFSKVYDEFAFTLKNMKKEYDRDLILSYLSEVGMENYIDANPYNMSYGQKQKIAIANSLAINSDYIVLDEVTAMLDDKSKKDIYKIIKRLKNEGKTVIFTTNLMEELVYADNIIVLTREKNFVINKKNLIKNIEQLENLGFSIPLSLNIIKILESKNIKIDYNDEEILSSLRDRL